MDRIMVEQAVPLEPMVYHLEQTSVLQHMQEHMPEQVDVT